MPEFPRPFTTFEIAMEFLYSQLPMYRRSGDKAIKKDLNNIRHLCHFLNAPHLKYPVIHVAGTNGKGTVSHILAAILQANGLRTGLYTSPHYTDYRERIRIDGQMISEEQVVRFVNKITSEIEAIRPSFFELSVAMAFDHFANEKVDIAVIETGLGGRLDSTNIVSPLLSVITNIGIDHQAMLGDTLPLIAAEKAGIIKPGVPVVIGERHPSTDRVWTEKAGERKSPLTFAQDIVRLKQYEIAPSGLVFSLEASPSLPTGILSTDLHGPFQEANLTTALAAFEILFRQSDLTLDAAKSIEALQRVHQMTGYKGRWEIAPGPPLIIADSGHNIHSLPANIAYLQKMPHRRLHIVLGMVRDKSHDPILETFPKDAIYYFARPNVPRGMEATALQHKAHHFGLRGYAYSNVRAALEDAIKKSTQDDIIFVGGSTFVVADYLQISNNMKLPKIVQKYPYVLTLEPKPYAWCTCGLSDKDPFCDGSHKEVEGFKSLRFEIEETKKVALCGCKHTKTPPYCDGSHKAL